jgi:hypothetical protein
VHALRSAPTRCCCIELNAQLRYQAYFRLYRSDRPEGKEGTFPEALLDTWHEFEGMRDVVREMWEQEQENGSAGSTAAAAVAARL